MFMLMKIDGQIVAKTVRAEPRGSRRATGGQLRTRDGWARKMGPIAAAMGVRHYAFRMKAGWWRYDVASCDDPVLMPNQEAAEMWLMYRG